MIALYNSSNSDGFAMPGTEGNWKGVTTQNDSATKLSYRYNNLSGPLPPELRNLKTVGEFRINTNYLSGQLPSFSGNVSSLNTFDAAGNKFEGPIPTALGNCTNLEFFIISGNRISGEIPAAITKLVNLVPSSNNVIFGFNALYSTNIELRTFLNQKDPDWESPQTIDPTNVSAVTQSQSAIRLSWDAILFTGESGGYNVYYGTGGGTFAANDGRQLKSICG